MGEMDSDGGTFDDDTKMSSSLTVYIAAKNKTEF